jgi:hypothetical protein
VSDECSGEDDCGGGPFHRYRGSGGGNLGASGGSWNSQSASRTRPPNISQRNIPTSARLMLASISPRSSPITFAISSMRTSPNSEAGALEKSVDLADQLAEQGMWEAHETIGLTPGSRGPQ